jgi:hypothetical protein
VSDELDEVRRYVDAIAPPDQDAMARVRSRLRVPAAADGFDPVQLEPHRRTRTIGWVVALAVVLVVGAALLVPSLGHDTAPPHPDTTGAHLQDRLTRLLVDDVSVTVAAGNYDMTFTDTTTPATTTPTTQCAVAESGGQHTVIVRPGQPSTGAIDQPCWAQSPPSGISSSLSSISGHGTVDTNPYAMVTVGNIGSLGLITLYDNGTDVWEIGGGNYGLSAPGQAGPGAPLSGYAGSVEGTVGQVQGALDMEALASGTGYMDLEAREIQATQPAGTGTVDGVPVTIYKLSESGLLDPTIGGLTSEQISTIRAADAIIKSSGFAGKTTLVSVDSEGYIREQKTQYTLPDGSMVTEDTILSNFGCAGTVLVPGQAGTSSPPAGCVSPDTASAASTTTPSTDSVPQPSTPTTANTSVPPTSVVPTTLAPTPVPTTQPSSSNCVTGSASTSVQTPSSSICIDVGTTLTVTFDYSHVSTGPVGGWIGPAETDNSSVASLTGSAAHGTRLVATVKAIAPGTATLSGYFSQECSVGDSTPCTAPPQGVLRLAIDVDG